MRIRTTDIRTLAWRTISLYALSYAAGAQTDEAARQAVEMPTGVVAGVVRDARQLPVAEALVVICDQASGIPLGATTHIVFLGDPDHERYPEFDDWWFARTDAAGAFRFEKVPAGEYRLVAQSWPDVERPEAPLEVSGLTVHLRGRAEHVRVPGAAAEAVAIGPLGDGTFVYHRGSSNNDWYLFLSAGNIAADPVLGPLGWKGSFLQNAVGYGRMPAGQLIVRGLPSVRIAYAIFANDNNPGFGAGAFRALPGEIVAHDTNVVAGWSDAIHDPPPHLEELCDELGALMESEGTDAVQAILVRGREEAWESHSPAGGLRDLFAVAEVLGPLDREVELPSGWTATVAEVMAAAAYARLRG